MQDKLWLKTGVDQDDLEFHIGALKMEEDEEYLQMLKEYNEVMENLQKWLSGYKFDPSSPKW